MANYLAMDREALTEEQQLLRAEYQRYKNMGLSLNMARGKPCTEQLDLSKEMLKMEDYTGENGFDARNYGLLEGMPEARRFFADLLGVKKEEVIVGGNSSLQLMYYLIDLGWRQGFVDSPRPWRHYNSLKFLCPVPGYDRHFRVTEYFGFQMINIPMTENGPDMDMVEELVKKDDSVKGIWCVPVYSNPDGYCYSDETVRRLARMQTAAPDFKIIWDNAYIVHHLTDEACGCPNILSGVQSGGPCRAAADLLLHEQDHLSGRGRRRAGRQRAQHSEHPAEYDAHDHQLRQDESAASCAVPQRQAGRAGAHEEAPRHSGTEIQPCKRDVCGAAVALRRDSPLDEPEGRLFPEPLCGGGLRQTGGAAVQGCRPDADRRGRFVPVRSGPERRAPAHRTHVSQAGGTGKGLHAADDLRAAGDRGKTASHKKIKAREDRR
jgi:hypothetical protein